MHICLHPTKDCVNLIKSITISLTEYVADTLLFVPSKFSHLAGEWRWKELIVAAQGLRDTAALANLYS